MTEQEIFDKVAQHLLTQNEKARDRDGCKYRQPRPDGRVLKCAVGCLIEDGEYGEWMEGQSVDGLMRDEKLSPRLSKMFRAREDILPFLQSIHDVHEPDEWATELRLLAEDRGLDTKVLDEVAK